MEPTIQTISIAAVCIIWGFKGGMDLLDRLRPNGRNGRGRILNDVETLKTLRDGLATLSSISSTVNQNTKMGHEAINAVGVMSARLETLGKILTEMNRQVQQRDQLHGQLIQVLGALERRVEQCPVRVRSLQGG
jgi:hypothetical protein